MNSGDGRGRKIEVVGNELVCLSRLLVEELHQPQLSGEFFCGLDSRKPDDFIAQDAFFLHWEDGAVRGFRFERCF